MTYCSLNKRRILAGPKSTQPRDSYTLCASASPTLAFLWLFGPNDIIFSLDPNLLSPFRFVQSCSFLIKRHSLLHAVSASSTHVAGLGRGGCKIHTHLPSVCFSFLKYFVPKPLLCLSWHKTGQVALGQRKCLLRDVAFL